MKMSGKFYNIRDITKLKHNGNVTLTFYIGDKFPVHATYGKEPLLTLSEINPREAKNTTKKVERPILPVVKTNDSVTVKFPKSFFYYNQPARLCGCGGNI